MERNAVGDAKFDGAQLGEMLGAADGLLIVGEADSAIVGSIDGLRIGICVVVTLLLVILPLAGVGLKEKYTVTAIAVVSTNTAATIANLNFTEVAVGETTTA